MRPKTGTRPSVNYTNSRISCVRSTYPKVVDGCGRQQHRSNASGSWSMAFAARSLGFFEKRVNSYKPEVASSLSKLAFEVCLFNCWINNSTLGALQMKMTAPCGIQKFRWREKIKHFVKILGGRDPCGVDTYDRNLAVFKIFWMPQMSQYC